MLAGGAEKGGVSVAVCVWLLRHRLGALPRRPRHGLVAGGAAGAMAAGDCMNSSYTNFHTSAAVSGRQRSRYWRRRRGRGPGLTAARVLLLLTPRWRLSLTRQHTQDAGTRRKGLGGASLGERSFLPAAKANYRPPRARFREARYIRLGPLHKSTYAFGPQPEVHPSARATIIYGRSVFLFRARFCTLLHPKEPLSPLPFRSSFRWPVGPCSETH